MTRDNYDKDNARDMKRRRKYTKRRQQVHRQILAIVTTVVLVLVLIVSNSFRKHEEKDVKTSSKVASVKKETTKQEIKKTEKQEIQETAEEKIARVKKEAETAGYPENVVDLLSKNPETVDFVESYGEKKDVKPAASLSENLEGENQLEYSGKIPKLLQWDERWGYGPYGTSIIAVSGCGPTCLSMVVAGLTGDETVTPAVVAEYGTANNAVDEGNNTYWSFMMQAGANWGLACKEGNADEGQVKAELEAGHPIICSLRPGDFTQIGHFIVLTSYKDGKVTVCDPFSVENTEKEWVYSEIRDQIKAMWIYSLQSEG